MAVQNTTQLLSDGRRARGERTRLKVLEALLALVQEGQLRPTAQEIARRAGVALRTVYHHFPDVEALRRVALNLQIDRSSTSLQAIDPALSLDERITAVTQQCRRLLESITPIRRATLSDELGSRELASNLQHLRTARRNHLAAVFAKEIARQPDRQRLVLDALDVTTSWQAWHHLRFALGRSANASSAIVAETIADILSAKKDGKSRN